MSSDSDVKELADLRQWLEDKIKSLEDELDSCRRMISVVDRQLSAKSFVKAAKVPFTEPPPVEEEVVVAALEKPEKRPLKRQRDGYLLAEAVIEKDKVTIDIAPDVLLRPATPPFKTYFIGKVLGSMRSEDEKQLASGKLAKEQMLKFSYDEEGNRLRKIVVEGYRDKVRLNEILSTAAWTFTKMLEKQT
jgi:hypothetical protein